MTATAWWAQPSLWRFLVVGVAVTAVDFAVLILLHGILNLAVVPSAVIAFMVAFIINFGLSRTWTFAASAGSAGRQLTRFILLVAANTVMTALGMALMTGWGLQYLVAKTVLTGAIVACNYVIMRRWIFVPERERNSVQGLEGPRGNAQQQDREHRD